MPKGQTKKKTHTKKTQVPVSVQRDITNAVNSLPSLLVDPNTLQSIHNKQQTHTAQPDTSSQSSKSISTYEQPQHSGTLLIAGVAFLMTTILGLWIWNMKAMVYTVFDTPSAEKQILTDVGDDFGDIITYIESQDTVSDKLNELQSAAAAAAIVSSTPTSTHIKAVLSAALQSQHVSTTTP